MNMVTQKCCNISYTEICWSIFEGYWLPLWDEQLHWCQQCYYANKTGYGQGQKTTATDDNGSRKTANMSQE